MKIHVLYFLIHVNGFYLVVKTAMVFVRLFPERHVGGGLLIAQITICSDFGEKAGMLSSLLRF